MTTDRPLKIAFVCNHGMTSSGVAAAFSHMFGKLPGIEVINQGFGLTNVEHRENLTALKPDVAFFVVPTKIHTSSDYSPSFKLVPPEEWALKKVTSGKYECQTPEITSKAKKYLAQLGPSNYHKNLVDPDLAEDDTAKAITAHNWLEKNGYIKPFPKIKPKQKK